VDGDGSLRAVVRDIGADRQALVELTSQRAFLRQVLDLDPNLIFAKDRDGRFTLANRAVASIYGVTPSELVGRRTPTSTPTGRDRTLPRRRSCGHELAAPRC